MRLIDVAGADAFPVSEAGEPNQGHVSVVQQRSFRQSIPHRARNSHSPRPGSDIGTDLCKKPSAKCLMRRGWWRATLSVGRWSNNPPLLMAMKFALARDAVTLKRLS